VSESEADYETAYSAGDEFIQEGLEAMKNSVCETCGGNHTTSEHADDVASEQVQTFTVAQVQEMAKQVGRDNAMLIKELASIKVGPNGEGIEPDQVGVARIEMLFQMMLEVGMIPADFMAAFELRWEQHFNQQLRNIRKEALAAKQAAEREAFQKNILMGTNINPKTVAAQNPRRTGSPFGGI